MIVALNYLLHPAAQLLPFPGIALQQAGSQLLFPIQLLLAPGGVITQVFDLLADLLEIDRHEVKFTREPVASQAGNSNRIES